ncbi:MAG: hypothetical protein V1835_04315 [Candidatus Micrarchaeota archaeon]
MENYKRREELRVTEDERTALDRIFYNRKSGRGYGNHPFVKLLQKESTIGEKYKALGKLSEKTKIDRLKILHFAIDMLGSGHSVEHQPYAANAHMQLLKMMPADHLIRDDARGLRSQIIWMGRHDDYWKHLPDTEREKIKGNLETMASAIERKIQPKGGKPDEAARKRITKEQWLGKQLEETQERLRKAVKEHEDGKENDSRLHKRELAELTRQLKNATEQLSSERVRATAALTDAARLRVTINDALIHLDTAHGQLDRRIVMPAHASNAWSAVDTARRKLKNVK